MQVVRVAIFQILWRSWQGRCISLTETHFVVQNSVGLHSRPATLLIKAASKFQSKILIIKDKVEADAKSILSLITLGAGKGDKILIRVDGIDEAEAIEGILSVLESLED
jgi:phosphocarrier protein